MNRLAIAAIACFTIAASAQTPIRVRLVDGKSGKALTPTSIRVQPSPEDKPEYLIPAADPASVLVTVHSATSISVTNQFVSCAAAKPDAPAAQYSVQQILSHGIVSANTCGKGKATVQPKPGELVLYVRHATPCEESKKHITGINFCN